MGGYFVNVFAVRPGKSFKKFRVIALCSVVSDGEKSAACANATNSGILCVALTWFACG